MNRPLAALALFVLLPFGSPVLAQDDPMAVPFGEISYRIYCEDCHGAAGTGDGPLAEGADPPPIDLTILAEMNDGVFPRARVTEVIDGREEVVGHLGIAMPPWARLFAHELEEFAAPGVREGLVQRRIAHLVAYLESIQR